MSKPDYDNKNTFLLTEYGFMQKCYEIQFNHFMAVFYFWITVITVPVSATLISNLGPANLLKSPAYGFLCLIIAFIGLFLSLKMFDIRRSQLRYVDKLNDIRCYFSNKYLKNSDNLILLGLDSQGKRNKDPMQEARTDFGSWMAVTMSFTNGALAIIGLYVVLPLLLQPLNYLTIPIFFGVLFFLFNSGLYYLYFFPKKRKRS